MAYPTGTDVTTLLTSLGLTVPSGYDLNDFATGAKEQWESLCGYTPFLQDASATARDFDPPGTSPSARSFGQYGGLRILLLRAGIVNQAAITSVVASGQTLVNGTDYRIAPLNASANKKPYSRIEFNVPIYGQASSIVVTARWGAYASLPQEVFNAIRRQAAADFAMDRATGKLSSGITQIKDDDVSITRTSEVLGTLAAWSEALQRIRERYERKDQFF
jgi:hypothetical protein